MVELESLKFESTYKSEEVFMNENRKTDADAESINLPFDWRKIK